MVCRARSDYDEVELLSTASARLMLVQRLDFGEYVTEEDAAAKIGEVLAGLNEPAGPRPVLPQVRLLPVSSSV